MHQQLNIYLSEARREMIMAAEASLLEENCFYFTAMSSSDEESSNQRTTETVDSGKEINFVEIQQSVCDRSSQNVTLLDILKDVKEVFESICNGIGCFIKLPLLSIQRVLQFVSLGRQFVPIRDGQQGRLVGLEALDGLPSSRVIEKINEMEHHDTQSTETSREAAPRPVAESFVRNLPNGSKLKKRLLRFYMFKDLLPLAQLAELILKEYADESEINFEKIFDYILCFKIMKEDYHEKVQPFNNIEKDAKSDSERGSYELLLHAQYLSKIIDKYIAKVEYGIFILKAHEKLNKEVQYISASIRQIVQVIKVSEFYSNERK